MLTATRGQTEYGICSTAFLEYAFRTDSYRIEVVFNPDGSWSYVTDTVLTVHGRTEPFAHRDQNTLMKVSEPLPNPLARIIAAKLRWYAFLFGGFGAALLTVLALVSRGALASLLALLAAFSGIAGALVERWLFFAEATHTVTLYYGRRPD